MTDVDPFWFYLLTTYAKTTGYTLVGYFSKVHAILCLWFMLNTSAHHAV